MDSPSANEKFDPPHLWGKPTSAFECPDLNLKAKKEEPLFAYKNQRKRIRARSKEQEISRSNFQDKSFDDEGPNIDLSLRIGKILEHPSPHLFHQDSESESQSIPKLDFLSTSIMDNLLD